MRYLTNFCNFNEVLLNSMEFGEILHEFLCNSVDIALLGNILDLIRRCCEYSNGNQQPSITWAIQIEFDVLSLCDSKFEMHRALRSSLYETASALLDFCDGNNETLTKMFRTYMQTAPFGDISFSNWIHGLRFLMRKWPFLYDSTQNLWNHLFRCFETTIQKFRCIFAMSFFRLFRELQTFSSQITLFQ